MAELTRSLTTILAVFHAAAEDMDRLTADAGNYTPEGLRGEATRRMDRHRAAVDKITAHLKELEAGAVAAWDAEVADAIDMPKVTAMERVASEMEAARVLARGPLEIPEVWEYVNPLHEEVTHPARSIIMAEAVARGVTTRKDLADHLVTVSGLAAAAAENVTTVKTALMGCLRPVLEQLNSVVNESRSDRTTLQVNYLELLEAVTGLDGLEVKGVPTLKV